MKNKNVSRIKNRLDNNFFIKRESSCTLRLRYTDNVQ